MPELRSRLGHILVLDIESAPDPAAVSIAGRGGQMERSALHRLMAFSTLRVQENSDGRWSDMLLTSQASDDELEMLGRLDGQITGLHETGGLLVTYNGISHDLGVLRRRLQANLAFGLRGIADARDLRHLDLMHEASRGRRQAYPSLRDSCAGLGIPTNHLLTSTRTEPLPAPVRKGQVDVAATFLLLLHEVALARGELAPLLSGWIELARHFGTPQVRAPHLEQFRHNPLLAGSR